MNVKAREDSPAPPFLRATASVGTPSETAPVNCRSLDPRLFVGANYGSLRSGAARLTHFVHLDGAEASRAVRPVASRRVSRESERLRWREQREAALHREICLSVQICPCAEDAGIPGPEMKIVMMVFSK